MSHSEKTVLFSPIGGHDPMGNFSDGPMLRICRVYKPQKVYLFFSREMWEHHNQDNRYLYCLDKLCGELGVEIAHEEIFDENLVDVQPPAGQYFLRHARHEELSALPLQNASL